LDQAKKALKILGMSSRIIELGKETSIQRNDKLGPVLKTNAS
jgi:hypothetical protein